MAIIATLGWIEKAGVNEVRGAQLMNFILVYLRLPCSLHRDAGSGPSS